MGTSKSNNGPGDKTPLLPDWAQPDDQPEPDPPVPDEDLPPEEEDAPVPVPVPRFWQQAKSSMRRFVNSGDQSDLAKTGRNYVKARGGARSAAENSAAGRTSTGRVVNFLADVANRGVVEALQSLGLDNVLGQSVDAVLSAIINALAPAGATLEDAVARKAQEAVLLTIFEEYAVDAEGIERLNDMNAADVEKAFTLTVSEYIYQLWMMELGKRVDEGTVTARDALKLEKLVSAYVTDATSLDLRGRDILTSDWTNVENQRIINDIYAQAYGFLEESE